MKYSRSEEAVSPLISIILIIAVVVILGAVIGMVAMGTIGGTQGNAKSVLVSANKGSSGITFTVQGGMDLGSVTSLDLVSGSTITNCTGSAPKVGQGCTVGTDSNGRTVMVARFTDGSKQVVFDKNWGSVSGSLAGSDYLTFTITAASIPSGDPFYPYYYAATYTHGPKWADIATIDIDDGVQNIPGQDPGSVDSLVTGGYIRSIYGFTKLHVVAHLNDGSTVTINDQTFT